LQRGNQGATTDSVRHVLGRVEMNMPSLFPTHDSRCGGAPTTDAASAAIVAAVVGFVALIVLAMAEYPGGTGWDATTRGSDFWLNYLCDLERSVALNGQPNAFGSALAQAAMLVLASGLLVFWWALPRLFPASPRLGCAVRALGLATLPGMLAVSLLPSDRFPAWHPIAMVLAGLPGLAAAALGVLGMAREPPLRIATAVGGAAVVTSMVDFVLYVRQFAGVGPGPTALAVLERAALILVLAWMCVIAWGARRRSR
jgi:hypothetical protein